MAKYDWRTIEKEYVEGLTIDGKLTFPSQAELCRKYNISTTQMCNRVNNGQWNIKREIFSNKVATLVQEKKAETISDEGSRFDLDCFNTAKAGTEKVISLLANTVNYDDLNKLSTALKNFQTVGKNSLGDGQTKDGEIRIKVNLVDD